MANRSSLSLIRRLCIWIEDYWGQVFYLLGSLLLALAGILSSIQNKDWTWLAFTNYGRCFVVGIILSISGALKTMLSSSGNRSLTDEVERLNQELNSRKRKYAKVINAELYVLSQILDFGSEERISLYKHEKNAFIMLGRYSINPEHKKKGRGIYPSDQGCIGEAWRQGKAFVDNLPAEKNRYCQILETKWNLPRNVTEILGMKSRTISAVSICGFSNPQDRVAVIVFESLRDSAFEKDRIEEVMKSGEEKRIALLLEEMVDIEPNSTYALNEGY